MPNKYISIWNKIKTFCIEHPVIHGLLWMIVAGVIFVNLALWFLASWTNHGEEIMVPEVKGLTYIQASYALENSGLRIEISDSVYDTSVAPGTVIESWPKSGSLVKAERKIYVTVSAFSSKMIEIGKPVEGVSVRQAVSYLNARGINAIRFKNVPSEFPDLVMSATYESRPILVGTNLPIDATVVLEVGVPLDPEDETDSISAETESSHESIFD